MENDLNNSEPIGLNGKPEGIKRIRRRPLALFVLCFVGLIIFQIFNISHKKEEREEQKKKDLAQASLNQNGNVSGEQWFEKDAYNNLRDQFGKEKVDEGNSVITELPLMIGEARQKNKEEPISKLNEEKIKSELEINRLKQREKVETQKAYFDAVKSPGQIARFKNKQNLQIDTVRSVQSSTGFGQSATSESLLSKIPQGLIDDDLNKQRDKINFLKNGVLPGDYLPHIKQSAISPYEVKAGNFIPAALITGLNSDLPGMVVAQVRQNVYDTVTGKYLLIPQGSRLVGEYDSKITYGQNRALVVWTRLTFPDGASISLEKMQGVDLAGYSGFKDKVNNHYLRIYGNALLLSLVGAGYEVLNPQANSEGTGETVASNIGQQLAQVASQITRKNIDIQPTIIIRPGYKLNVFVLKDMILDEYKHHE